MAVGGAGELPTEFRLFVAGANDTEKGALLFDDVAAESVMAAAARWGIDFAIDLEHQMLDEPGPDPTARDARGWFNLQLRADGSLWAVNVRWTDDGAARLLQGRQRYISPAADYDPKTGRIVSILNVALVAMPATRNAPALIAASVTGGCMDPKQVQAALDALIAGDSDKCSEILQGMIAAAASGVPSPEAPIVEESAPPQPPPAADDPETKAEVAAASKLARLSGKKTLSEALPEIEVWRASHVAAETERTKLAAEREALEGAERKRLCIELITLGAEFPATVWLDDKAVALKPRWAKMPISELKTLAAEQRAARGGAPKTATAPRGAVADDAVAGSKTFVVEGKTVTLSAREIAICTESKCEPETFALLKSRRTDKESR